MPKTTYRCAMLIGRASAIALAACAASGALLPQAAAAQSATAARNFDLPAGDLAAALSRFGEQTGLALVYPAELTRGKSTGGVSGNMTPSQALSRLLAGTGLTFRFDGANTLVIESAGVGADGELVTGVVSVEGYQGSPYFGGAGVAAGVNGINGSRDITATEGTGSFTSGALTIGSKVPQAMKDVPQSISVLTSERLEQQNVTDFTTAMKQLPGVTLVQAENSLETTFYSRGFAINSIQVDGGAPLATGFVAGGGFGYYPQIDMSIYDHVELLRGAAGLLNGYGSPSGTVNLVRKKPLDHGQVIVEAQAGSWSNYRVVADATSPIALDGKLRGRLVMTYQDNRYFYDTAKNNKTLIYGIAELDATPTTLVTAGINYTRQDSVPWMVGLPRYLNGEDLKLPRSTCLCFDWNRWDFDTTELFSGIEQKMGEDWTAKLNLTHIRQASTQKAGFSRGGVNPTNGLGPQLYANYTNFASEQLSAEVTLSGAFELFGQRQEVTVGANRVNSDGGGQVNYAETITTSAATPYQPYPGGPLYYSGSPNGSRPPVHVFDFDPSDPLYTEPRNPLPSIRYNKNGQTQSGAYINLRLTAFDRLHLTTGLRWSRYEYEYEYETLCTATTGACAGKAIGDVNSAPPAQTYVGEDFTWPPPINLSFDVTKELAVYAGYTDIYQSQANQLSADLKPLPPITGANWEGGVKWAAHDGKLNLSLAAYRIRQKGFAMIDPPDYSGYFDVSPGISCCYIADPNLTYESKGIDFDATGELLPGWQVAVSFTYNHNQYKGITAELYGVRGQPLVTIAPEHLYKLWMSYDFGAAGHIGALSGLTISAGANGQSSGYNTGNTCIRFVGDPDPVTGSQACAPNNDPNNPSRIDYRFRVPPYTLLAARIEYRLSGRWLLALNIDNILDKTYYQTTGSIYGSNWYGAPRSFTASLRAKW